MTICLPLHPSSSSSATEHSSTRKNLSALSLVVAKSKRAIIVTGAGISCSSGIPDFRSSDGLYALVKSRHPNTVMKGRDLFSASLFRDPASTRLFYTFIAELKSSIDTAKPSPTHRFIKTLDSKGKLVRSYTQNIDGFEEQVGLAGTLSVKGKGKKFNSKEIKNVQLHGDIHRVRCMMCSAEYPCTSEYMEAFREGTPPDCPDCSNRSAAREARAARSLAIGTLRPNIVLYDEVHPLGDEIADLSTRDMARKPDILIIMGTSLKVHGLKRLVKDFAAAVHQPTPPTRTHTASGLLSPSPSPSPSKFRPASNMLSSKKPRIVVYVNRTPPPPGSEWANVIDYWVQGETDAWVQKCESDWKRMRPQDWEVQPTLFDALSAAAPKNKQISTVGMLEQWSVVKENSTGEVGNKISFKKSKANSTSNHALFGAENVPPDGSTTVPSPPPSPSRPRPIRSVLTKVRSKSKATATIATARQKSRKPSSSCSISTSASNIASTSLAGSSQVTAAPLSPSKRGATSSQQTYVNDDGGWSSDLSEMDVDEYALGGQSPRKKRSVYGETGDAGSQARVEVRRGLLFETKGTTAAPRDEFDMSLDDIIVRQTEVSVVRSPAEVKEVVEPPTRRTGPPRAARKTKAPPVPTGLSKKKPARTTTATKAKGPAIAPEGTYLDIAIMAD